MKLQYRFNYENASRIRRLETPSSVVSVAEAKILIAKDVEMDKEFARRFDFMVSRVADPSDSVGTPLTDSAILAGNAILIVQRVPWRPVHDLVHTIVSSDTSKPAESASLSDSNSVPARFICAHCLGLLSVPMSIRCEGGCNKAVCKKCAVELMNAASADSTGARCPNCKGIVKQFIVNKALGSLISKLTPQSCEEPVEAVSGSNGVPSSTAGVRSSSSPSSLVTVGIQSGNLTSEASMSSESMRTLLGGNEPGGYIMVLSPSALRFLHTHSIVLIDGKAASELQEGTIFPLARGGGGTSWMLVGQCRLDNGVPYSEFISNSDSSRSGLIEKLVRKSPDVHLNEECTVWNVTWLIRFPEVILLPLKAQPIAAVLSSKARVGGSVARYDSSSPHPLDTIKLSAGQKQSICERFQQEESYRELEVTRQKQQRTTSTPATPQHQATPRTSAVGIPPPPIPTVSSLSLPDQPVTVPIPAVITPTPYEDDTCSSGTTSTYQQPATLPGDDESLELRRIAGADKDATSGTSICGASAVPTLLNERWNDSPISGLIFDANMRMWIPVNEEYLEYLKANARKSVYNGQADSNGGPSTIDLMMMDRSNRRNQHFHRHQQSLQCDENEMLGPLANKKHQLTRISNYFKSFVTPTSLFHCIQDIRDMSNHWSVRNPLLPFLSLFGKLDDSQFTAIKDLQQRAAQALVAQGQADTWMINSVKFPKQYEVRHPTPSNASFNQSQTDRPSSGGIPPCAASGGSLGTQSHQRFKRKMDGSRVMMAPSVMTDTALDTRLPNAGVSVQEYEPGLNVHNQGMKATMVPAAQNIVGAPFHIHHHPQHPYHQRQVPYQYPSNMPQVAMQFDYDNNMQVPQHLQHHHNRNITPQMRGGSNFIPGERHPHVVYGERHPLEYYAPRNDFRMSRQPGIPAFMPDGTTFNPQQQYVRNQHMNYSQEQLRNYISNYDYPQQQSHIISSPARDTERLHRGGDVHNIQHSVATSEFSLRGPYRGPANCQPFRGGAPAHWRSSSVSSTGEQRRPAYVNQPVVMNGNCTYNSLHQPHVEEQYNRPTSNLLPPNDQHAYFDLQVEGRISQAAYYRNDSSKLDTHAGMSDEVVPHHCDRPPSMYSDVHLGSYEHNVRQNKMRHETAGTRDRSASPLRRYPRQQNVAESEHRSDEQEHPLRVEQERRSPASSTSSSVLRSDQKNYHYYHQNQSPSSVRHSSTNSMYDSYPQRDNRSRHSTVVVGSSSASSSGERKVTLVTSRNSSMRVQSPPPNGTLDGQRLLEEQVYNEESRRYVSNKEHRNMVRSPSTASRHDHHSTVESSNPVYHSFEKHQSRRRYLHKYDQSSPSTEGAPNLRASVATDNTRKLSQKLGSDRNGVEFLEIQSSPRRRVHALDAGARLFKAALPDSTSNPTGSTPKEHLLSSASSRTASTRVSSPDLVSGRSQKKVNVHSSCRFKTNTNRQGVRSGLPSVVSRYGRSPGGL